MPTPKCSIAIIRDHVDDHGKQAVDTLVNLKQHGYSDRQVADALREFARTRGLDVKVHRMTVCNHRQGACACERR